MDRDPRHGIASPAGQVPCPYCRAAIALPVEDILAGTAIHCAACGARLQTDRAGSAAALAVLERWHAGTAEARHKADQGKAAGSERQPRTRRRRKPRP